MEKTARGRQEGRTQHVSKTLATRFATVRSKFKTFLKSCCNLELLGKCSRQLNFALAPFLHTLTTRGKGVPTIMSKSKRILLVEDSPDDVFFFQRAARKAGLGEGVEIASDGARAIHLLQDKTTRGAPLPHLVFLDLKMPHKDGFEVLEWVRENPTYSSVPVVVLSSSDQPSDLERASQLGARLSLTKTVTAEQLQDTVGKFCDPS